jgi:quercetin dioxygenase-like cupin family protein
MTDQTSTAEPAPGFDDDLGGDIEEGVGRDGGSGARSATEMVVLSELADALIADLPRHPSGRTARTVLSGTVMRAVVIAIREGATLAEHDSPSAATLYVISGEVSLRTANRDWSVSPGQLVPIPPRRHSIVAHADSAFLLTVALR